jgi:general secretion pathway protein A
MSNPIFSFFGLRENPFKINPDPRFLFLTERARAATDELAYAIRTRKGLILLTGEVGTGKTMLLRHLLNWLAEQKMPTALIVNSHIQPDHLLDFILNDFGIPCTSPLKSDKLLALNAWLLERYRAGQTPVLIVDEAQGLEFAALEEIRLLLNFETPREKLLQIVLAGQPELDVKLKQHELRQLRQRITIRCRTAPLTLEQTYAYIRERLNVAGANGNLFFQPDAVGCIHAYSRGIPRVINVLCEHSLVNACAEGTTTISPEIVEQAARDCQLDRADSISRLLNTGSYSTTSLSDIGSILATIGNASESLEALTRTQTHNATRPLRPEPPGPLARPQVAEHVAPRMSKTPERQEPAVLIASSSSAATPLESDQPLPLYATFPPEMLQDVADRTSARARHQHSSFLQVLRLWGTSFAVDLRSMSRQLRREIRSFKTRQWQPFIHQAHRELRHLRMHGVRFLKHPRWQQLRARSVSNSRAYWRACKSSAAGLLQRFDIGQEKLLPRRNQTAIPGRAKRQRAIVSLRRWLHEPLSSQRKVHRVHRRHS